MANKKTIIKAVMGFLGIFMPETLVKRVMSIILMSIGMANKEITETTGLCDKSVRVLRKKAETGEMEGLFEIKSGSGRKAKLRDVESAIVEEVNKNTYHSRQQIADMILEKHGISVSLPAVGRLLKKTGLSV